MSVAVTALADWVGYAVGVRRLLAIGALLAMACGASPSARPPAAPWPTTRPPPAPPPPRAAEPQERSAEPRAVLVVSIDGLRRDYLDDTEHAIPTLRALAKEGTVARSLRSVWPTATYPAHTTMVTGVSPARHGILNNLVFDPYGKNQGGWYWYAHDIRVPTLWDVARDAGLDVANVTWPVTVGASIRWSVPQFWRARNDEDDKLVAALSTPGLCDDLRAAGKDLPSEHRTDRARADAAVVVLAKRPRLAFVYLTDLDTAQHVHGPRSEAVWKTLETTDRLLAEIVDAAKRASSRLAIVIVSDHGFSSITHEVRPNVALRRAGLLDATPDGRVTRYDAVAWRSGGTAAIMGAAKEHDRVRSIFDDLARDRRNGIARVLDGEEVAKMGGFPGALVVLQADDAATFVETAREPLVAPTRHKGGHGWAPTKPEMAASLVLSGDGVRRGAELGDVDMIDVAPTIAALVGLELPAADGKPLGPALEE